MSEEKQKNEDIIERRWDQITGAIVGFFVSLPVAVWMTMHLFYGQYRFQDGGWLPGVMTALDCLMNVAALLLLAGGAYAAGMRNLHREVIAELEKSE